MVVVPVALRQIARLITMIRMTIDIGASQGSAGDFQTIG